jgi:hypothetical protein
MGVARAEHHAALVVGDRPQRKFQSHEATTDWRFVRFTTERAGGAETTPSTTQGSTNPALTIVALASRLGEGLAGKRISASSPAQER